MSYKHLTTEERTCLAEYLSRGLSQTKIAALIGRNKSSISRELARNNRQYNPAKAQARYKRNKERCGRRRKIVSGNELYEKVVYGLSLDWSPEQIVNTITPEVSIGTIYRAFHNKTLRPYAKHLRILQFNRGWRKGHKRGNPYKNCRTIHQRPKKVGSREDFGHWELDTFVFSRREQKVLAVFVERKHGYAITLLLADQKAKTMREAVVETFSKFPKQARQTLTVDRGKEFEQWKEMEAALEGTRIYFCDPMRPQQKGAVENFNGLLRQYYPKKKKTIAPSPQELSVVQASLNNRPRKRLQFQTPSQLFHNSLFNGCT